MNNDNINTITITTTKAFKYHNVYLKFTTTTKIF